MAPVPQCPSQKRDSKINARKHIMLCWSQLEPAEREQMILELMRDTNIGRRIAESGTLPFIPHHMLGLCRTGQ
jgi:hypothetical protein